MKLEQCDFKLTNEQLLEINRKFGALVEAMQKGIVDPCRVVCVRFEFSRHGSLLSASSQLRFDEEEPGYAEVRPFTHADVSLTEEQLREISDHFNTGLRAIEGREGLFADLSSKVTLDRLHCWVTFEFGPGWRALEAGFGDFDEMENQCLLYPCDSWNHSNARLPTD